MALKDDNINLHINVTSNEAQESIRKLAETNRELEKTNKDIRLEMEKLKAQGKENSDEFRQLEAAYKSNTTSLAENSKQVKEHEKSLGLSGMTMTQLRKHAKDLQSQLDRTVQSTDPQGYAELQRQLEATRGRMGELRTAGQSLAGQLSSIPGPAGSVVQGVQGINSSFKMLLANPIMAVLAAIVLVFMALYKAIASSEEATNKLNAIMAPLQAIMDAILNVVQKCVGVILDFISVIIDGLMKALEKLPFVGKHFKEINDYAKEAITLEQSKQALDKRQRAATEENAKIERDVSELRNKSKQKDLYSEQERIKFIEEAIALERKRADENMAISQERLRIAETEAARAQNTAETENQLAQLRAEVYNAEKEYHDRTRRLNSELSNFKIQQETERKQKAKEALDAQLKTVEQFIASEKLKLSQAKLDKEITQEEFNEKMEALELESLNRKLAVHGLEKEQRDAINQSILDAKIKFQEEEEKRTTELTEKLRIDALSKTGKEIDDIRKKYESRQELLKEGLENELITETEYAARLAAMNNEMQFEIDKKQKDQQTANAAEKLSKKDKEQEEEKLRLLEQYAAQQITQEEYQQGLLDLEQQFLDEKLRINGLTEEQITKLKEQQLNKQISDQEKSLKKQEERQKKYTAIAASSAGQLGEILGTMAAGAEMTAEQMQYQMVMLALDTLKQIVLLAATEAIAKQVAALGPIFGPIAGAAAAGIITGAFEGVKSRIKKPEAKNKGEGNTSMPASGKMQVNQRASGKYDVIGADDHRAYKNVPFIGTPETGIVKQPALIAEQGEELIISTPDMQMLKKHINYPYIVSAINDVKAGTVQQRATGNYAPLEIPAAATRTTQPGTYETLEKIATLLENLNTNGVKSVVGLDQLDAQRKLRDQSRAIGTLKS